MSRLVIQGYKRFGGTGAAAQVDTGSVGTIVDGAVYPVKNITIRNLNLVASYYPGRPASMQALSNTAEVIAEAKNGGNYRTSSYTNASIFPAYGILMKYVDNVTIENSVLKYEETLRNDRFAVVIDNGTNVSLKNVQISQGGLIGSVIQVRGVSSYRFSDITVKLFDKYYPGNPGTLYSVAEGSTSFDSAVKANLVESHLFPKITSGQAVGIAFTATHILGISENVISVSAGTTVQNVLDEIISLRASQTISIVDSAENNVDSAAAITPDYRLKALLDGSSTWLTLTVQ